MKRQIRRAIVAVSLSAAAVLPASAQGLPPGFVRVADVVPGALQDVRYAGSNNFYGRPVPGYSAAECWLFKPVAEALARVEADARVRGLRLVLWDCYRPQRATDAFVRWAADPSDQATKAQYYPNIDKSMLFVAGYIAKNSSHSTGTAIDLGLATADGRVLDFGSSYDLSDPMSATVSTAVPDAARVNRALLHGMMAARGFKNYAREWWHYSYPPAGRQPTYDVPITAR
ncbi:MULTISPECIES: M15 family metallopeptidase [unclassified Beijerinckia]|uniref:M15 family metallopeptidase n=1 Tax=unclassified Beijerinckia TaxID=2638183 RepID=UPI0008959DB3|nr:MULTISPECIES: M15 family metallopeptidase [unclassified Beijerinckia]MDH7794674.1 D-alanyl-D-alanine dipeptidase [Beijerinckia sp. GAS462]SEB70762.1 D-Ala-D-Ala dipeptidase vanX. Metallo peptidase. MEROPS family M15D [Beijerinckia sp. 28-YEA-48]